MVRITKTMQAKHSETLSPWIRDFCSSAYSTPLPLLPQHLSTFPSRWPFPRGDLYHWVTLLNRLDTILERFCRAYKLDEGPQTEDFGCQILKSAVEDHGEFGGVPHQEYDLEKLGFGKEGDRQLIESILSFSRMLLQNCGNRSIYASSSHLNNLLNTTSASLLECTLLLGSELAQRYQAALKRMNLPPRHVSSALLSNHYNINLDRVLQLALPFTKTVTIPSEPVQPTTPSIKGKEKAYFQIPTSQKTTSCTLYANDLASLVKGGSGIISSSPKALRNGVDNTSTETNWEQWGDVKVTYYPKTTPEADAAPTTPTPLRTSSNLGPHGHRSNRQAASDENPSPVARSATFPVDDATHSAYNVVEISSSQVRSTDVHKLLRENISGLSQELQYELLAKLRIASALTTSLETRRQMLSIRLLAITNLAYIHSENALLEGVLKQDSDEPRRLQLVYQLVEMVHPPADGDVAIPRKLQTLALSALDALSSHQSKFSDVCAALNTNVNHGVLLYVVRKAVAEMHHEDTGDKVTADDEWRDTLFSLLSNLSLNPRTSGDLVTAGLIPILVEVLKLHSNIAERCHSKILTFLDNIMYNARDAFQTLVSAGGLDAVSDLIVFQVKAAADLAASGNGIQPEHRSVTVDYQIPYFQQQTLKWLLKFIHHMMSAAGGFGGNFDRLLRNLIDSSQLLGALRQIISNANCFGSIVWTNAVSILNDFINNEPTSFAIIAEAGLSRAFLEAVTGTPVVMPQQPEKSQVGEQTADGVSATANIPIDHSSDDDGDDTSDDDATVPPHRPSLSMLQAPRDHPLAQGILPTAETINIVPQAFGAICLNNAGMKMFQASRALESFFEIFESPEHVKCMDTNKDLAANLGGTFDELVRHHPPLKTAIMNAILDMVARVGYLCKVKAGEQKVGSKLWTTDSSGKSVVADTQLVNAAESHQGKDKALDNGSDVEMQDVGTEPPGNTIADLSSSPEETNPNASMTPYITAVVTFLSAILANTPIRSEFCDMGGTEYVLDLADSPCLPYDFADGIASRTLHGVVATLVEHRPYLVIPSLLKRAQSAADALAPFTSHPRNESFFAPFVDTDSRQHAEAQLVANGTNFAKAFVNLHSLVSTLKACFHPLTFNHRNASNSFNSLNISDYYVSLVQSLGLLLGRSLEEEIQLQKIVPGYWKNATRIKDAGFGEPIADNVLGVEPPSPGAEPSDPDLSASNLPSRPRTGGLTSPVADPVSGASNRQLKVPTKVEQESPYFKNFQTIRYLLGKMSQTISPFFQTLGKVLVLKRNSDGFQRQSHASIAKALAETVLLWLAPSPQASPVEQYSYWIGILHVLKEMLIDSSRVNERPLQIITIVLQAFKESGGFDGVNYILKTFTKDISSSNISLTETEDKGTEEYLRSQLATAGTRNILSLYALIVSGKIVTDSQQTMAMTTRSERDRNRPDHFSPPQFLVELRMAVLPIVRSLWRSELIEKGSSQICEKLIEVIRTIANADSEANAIKRSDKVVPSAKQPRKRFRISPEHLAVLTDSFDASIANEALYRCNNNIASASEYCREAYDGSGGRCPVPEGDIAPSSDGTTSSRPRTSTSTGTATPDDQTMTVDSRQDLQSIPPPNAEDIARSFDQVGQLDPGVGSADPSSTTEGDVGPPQITVDDLNEERDAIKEDLIDKCLDVINAHGDVTFEVADLITTVVSKSSDPQAQRKTVATTLVIALMSFAGEDDLRTSGKKIAAYANLLALMLRDKVFFFAAAIGDLKENLSTLFSFVRLSPNHSSDEPSPWIAHILLVVEMLLSEDARPQKTKWTAPKDDTDKIEPPVVEMAEQIVSSDERLSLFDAILDILPRIGKDEALALAVLRILVILTRARPVAQAMGEKKNIQRLFVMAKQLAGASSARIQSPLMVILRHIIEDDETIKQIMRSEIKSYFESSRQQRNVDVITYLRGLAHTAIRNPELFVDTTNEMVKFNRWTYPSEGSGRDSLALKDTLSGTRANKLPGDPVSPTVQATEDLSIQDVKPSTEGRDSEMTDTTKSTPVESKLPIVENPDGVIHFLLCELLNYKDVEDKDPPATVPNQADKPSTSGPSNDDTPMAGTASPPDQPSKSAKGSKSSTKQEFKAEDHPIFIYRCFILQCLTELLSSYNRTKIEFINFKRSAPPQAMTPSKPRSSVVNYLLFDLIPIGTLDHADTTVLRKKLVTSSWADSVLTALLSKTGENGIESKRQPYDTEDESDLLFVRKFVLENILKAYREASSSTEPLDFKYSRMLSLSDLMAHIMSGKENVGASDTALAGVSQKQLRRIMFEKGFIAALTSSIADIDLNFPGAKRAVKYILRPLKTLSTTAVQLSELGLVRDNTGQNDEDEIESATSVSDLEDEREETPDLFRNSTLGMFEPGREEDSSSESEDDEEEMYEGEYDEEMDYEEDGVDAEDNISDEDEEIEGMGPIEGLSGDHGVDVEVIMDDDDGDDDDESSSGDDEDEDDSEDDDARVEIIDEIEDGENVDDDGDLDEWESDEDDHPGDVEDYEDQVADHEEHELHPIEAMDMGGQLGHFVRALGGEDAAEMMERMEEQMEAEGIDQGDDDDQLGPDYGEEGDEDEEDEDEDDMDDEMLFEQGFTMDAPGAFGWQGEVEPPMVLHRRPRPGGFPPFPFFPGGPRDPLGGMSNQPLPSVTGGIAELGQSLARLDRIIDSVSGIRNRTNPHAVPDFRPAHRAHRPGGPPPRSGDDGTNPLLQRNAGPSRDGSSRPSTLESFFQAMGGLRDMRDFAEAIGGLRDMPDTAEIGFSGRPFGEEATASILGEVIRSLPAIPGTIARNGQALQFHITTGPGHDFPRDLQAMFGMTRGPRFETRREAGEPGSAAFFSPQSTNARWLEEAKLLFGQSHVERAADISNAIQAVLVPPAIEADKIVKAAEAERLRKLEEARKKAEEERRAQEAKEAEEKAAKEKQEAEEREAVARAEAEALAAQGPEPGAAEPWTAETEEMDGVETTEGPHTAEEEQPEEAPAADRPRVTTIIRGNPYDITDLGIDADFLAELPDEIREEVIMSAVAERRSQAAATGAQPSDIDQEFLDALPDDIRDEIIQQERQDRRRREREERSRQAAAASGGGPSAGDMDAASILATLPPALRNQVLMEQDEEMLALLPQDLAEQARAAQRDHPAHHGRPPPGFARRSGGPPVPEVDIQRPSRRATVQMLDKAGVATLLRLMFILQQGSLRNTLNSVLQNICMNRHNRSELLGTMLHILQDGSFDMTAVERSFAHLSLRAKQPSDKGPKTPQPLKRALTGVNTNSVAPTNFEASPLMVVQQCLSSLVYLTQVNPHIPAFFLTEHEPAGGLKRSLSRKGKGKDTKSARYPLNSLLSLLDRELIMESSSVMESLSTLLNMTTSPLQALQRKQKEAAEESKQIEAPPSATGAPATDESPGTTSTNDQAPGQQSEATLSQEPEVATTAPVTNSGTSAQPPPESAENGEPSVSTEAPATQPEATPKEPSKVPEKKQRPMVPPLIPDHNLKLVINIFVARECSSKTFRETLSTIKNFSAIPGAKAVFGRELISKAQALGEIILVDLQDLLPQIQRASSGTEIQGVALAKFSPGGSDQNKLLRVLTALDHLFDPKRDRKEGAGADPEGETSQLVEKQDLLSSLYENSTFGPMWEKLSECLRAIRQREHMLNVATILLPLIEALMVVCKNTTLKDTPISRSMIGKEMLLTSPPPESRMESLFFTFTEEHRKILNDLVRHTPKLMSGTFSLLVKNPKVLEFDNKRNYFNRSVHSKAPNGRQSFPPLQLSVRRDQVFHDSFKSLYFQTGDQMKYGKLSIRFHGEEGVDAGGVTREWFQVLSRQMFDPGYALFIPVSSDRTTFHPNQLSSINEEHLMFFKFIGRIIGKALYEGRVLDCHFSRAVYKRILGKPVSVKDMESLDLEYYKSLVWMLENDITDIITETFSVDNDKFGIVETIDFIPNGRNIAVTEENKHEYIRLMVEWKLTGSVQEQLDEFLKGFHDIIPAELISIFNEQELELLISGLPEIDVDDWKSNAEYHNYSASSPQIQWFWRAVRSFDKEERAKLLQFVTGTSKVPLNGFMELEGMNGFSRFNIHRDYGNKDRLPSSHTCFNQLDLPEYENYESLRQQVLTAITAGSEYFGFA